VAGAAARKGEGRVMGCRRRTFTVDELRELFMFNCDGDLCWRRPTKHHPRLVGNLAGSLARTDSGKYYCLVQIDGVKYRRSHVVFCLFNGRWPTEQIDHINGDSLHDRPENLREATPTQNAWNHKTRRKKSPLPMGVRIAVSGRYVARIAVNKRQITIGSFDSPDAASLAYQAARLRHFGVFA